MAASLDHALWFHRPFRADEWLLYAQDSPNLSDSRGFSRGLIFSRDGTLVASVAQEGLLRLRRPRTGVADRRTSRQLPALILGGLDDRPPLGDLGLLIGRERRRVLLIGREDDLAELREPVLHRRVGQRGLHRAHRAGRRLSLGRSLGGPQPMPERGWLTPGTPDSIIVGVSGDFGQRCSLMTANALNLPACTYGSVADASRQARSIWPPNRSCDRRSGAVIRHIVEIARRSSARTRLPHNMTGAAGADGAERRRLCSSSSARRSVRSRFSAESHFCRGSTAARPRAARSAADPFARRNRACRSPASRHGSSNCRCRSCSRRDWRGRRGRSRSCRWRRGGFDDDRSDEASLPCPWPTAAPARRSVRRAEIPPSCVIGCDG